MEHSRNGDGSARSAFSVLSPKTERVSVDRPAWRAVHSLHPAFSEVSSWAYDVYSQAGEDGIIAGLFACLGTRSRRCFEIGEASFSTTKRLREAGWLSVLIEYGLDSSASFNEALGPDAYDLGIIDAGGRDYWVMHDMAARPGVLVVGRAVSPSIAESSIPFIPPRNAVPAATEKANEAAVVALGTTMGYVAVAHTHRNTILVLQAAMEEAGIVPRVRRLNIGGGAAVLPGFENIDIAAGRSAYPIDAADSSIEAIRASHILEHYPESMVPKVLAEWHRILRLGGTLEISVPDFDLIASARFANDPMRMRYLMGGQTNEHDFHRSAFTRRKLQASMEQAGFDSIEPWAGDSHDTSAHPISLNLRGVRGPRRPITGEFSASVKAVMSLPRYGANDAWSAITRALAATGISLETNTGVFWGQCMEEMFARALAAGVEWILAIDYDSIFTAKHIQQLFATIARHPNVDAVAAFQKRRLRDEPLLSLFGRNEVTFRPGELLAVDSAHFGLTAIRTAGLRKMEHPWFCAQPNTDGRWGMGKVDDDIMFWRKWRAAGNTLYIDTSCRIGHLEVVIYEYADDYTARPIAAPDWWKREYADGGITDDAGPTHEALANVSAHSGPGACSGAIRADRAGSDRQGDCGLVRSPPSGRNNDVNSGGNHHEAAAAAS